MAWWGLLLDNATSRSPADHILELALCANLARQSSRLGPHNRVTLWTDVRCEGVGPQVVPGPLHPSGRHRGPLPPSNCPKIAGAGGDGPLPTPPQAPLRGTWAGLRPTQSLQEGI